MAFSTIGSVLTATSFVLFVYGRRELMWVTVFSIPFHAVEVADLGVTVISAFQLFGFSFILRCLLDGFLNRTKFRVSWTVLLAVCFIFICVLSLVMTVAKTGYVEVIPVIEGSWLNRIENFEPLKLSYSNFTQLLYPTFGVTIFYFLSQEMRGVNDLKYSIKLIVWGVLAVGLISVSGSVLYTIGLDDLYLNFFRVLKAGPLNIGRPVTGTFGSFFRTRTPAGEPGFTAITYLLGLGLLTGFTLGENSRRSIVRFPRGILAFLVFALLTNGSTTGYFGALLLVSWITLVPFFLGRTSHVRYRSILKVVLATAGVLVVAGTLLQVSGVPFYEWLLQYHIAKIQGEAVGSGQVRAQVSWYSLREVFLISPLLGVGYGSHLSLSLGTFLLSNIGLVGFGVFAALVVILCRNTFTVAANQSSELGSIAFAIMCAFVPLMGTLLIAKSAVGLMFGEIWLIFALSEAVFQEWKDQSQYRDKHFKKTWQ